jgi:uncharacterized protein YndB with AHSA1/START domain/uncharacterized protein YciI
MTSLLPIRRQVVVPGTAAAAFEVFTGEIGLWWPLADKSVYHDATAVSFRDGRLVERGPDGSEAVWGTVLDWDPPQRLRMTWHPASDPARASEVEVRFAAVTDTQTLVTVEHRGWERFADPAAARAEYNLGWPPVVERYASRMRAGTPAAPGTSADGPVWLALMHTAGPELPPGLSVFARADFAEHVAFLRRLDGRGVLVAAGSLDGEANGMTVLRVPDPADVATYARLAQDDDQSVVRGLLQVRVRPWRVALAGAAAAPGPGR